jgi:hypothetical protein
MKIIKDSYRRVRGGHSELLNIICNSCKNKILVYQKDGPGRLKRMYLDRIHAPKELMELQFLNTKNIPALRCKKCNQLIAIPYVYRLEKRKAFRLHKGTVIEKKYDTRLVS